MIKIAHRGNMRGANPHMENSPIQIDLCLANGFHAEIDVWFNSSDQSIRLGHDAPEYRVDWQWLEDRQDKLWIHCKNPATFLVFKAHAGGLNFFWHDRDLYTLTSRGVIWSVPGAQYDKNVVVLMPELAGQNFSEFSANNCYGVCTDFPERLIGFDDLSKGER